MPKIFYELFDMVKTNQISLHLFVHYFINEKISLGAYTHIHKH